LVLLALALRSFLAHEQPRWPGDEELEPSAPLRITSVQDPARVLLTDLEDESESANARITLVDESLAVVLPQVEYELRSSNDRPIVGARALLRRGEDWLAVRLSNESGVVHFDAGAGRAQLLLVAGEAAPVSLDVPGDAGRHLVVLERGFAVSGRVRLVGSGTLANIELELISDRPLVDESNWPPEVRAASDR
jgi:hypothetical protein